MDGERNSMTTMKYTVVYTANNRYDNPNIDYPTSRVEYIQGETLDEAIDEDYESMLMEESDLSNLSPEIEDSYEIDENGDRR